MYEEKEDSEEFEDTDAENSSDDILEEDINTHQLYSDNGTFI